MCVCRMIASAPRSRRRLSAGTPRGSPARAPSGNAQPGAARSRWRRWPAPASRRSAGSGQRAHGPRPTPCSGPARERAACVRETARTARPSQSSSRTAARTGPRGTPARARGCPSAARPRAPASARWASRRTPSRARPRAPGSARAPRPAHRGARSSAGTRPRRRARRRPRPGRARSAGWRRGSAAGRARAPRGWHRRPRRARRSARARPTRTPRRRPCRSRAGRGPARRSTRTRPGGGETSSSPRARREACAPRSAPAAARPRAGRAAHTPARTPGGEYMVPLVAGALTAEEIRDVNTRYHDAAAAAYDAKWGIDFGVVGREQVILKLTKALGRPPPHYARSLEIGAGGTMLFAGEPSRYGDSISRAPKRLASALAPAWRRAVGARAAVPAGPAPRPDTALEGIVDVHAFAPGELQRAAARAGLCEVRVAGEGFLAHWFGLANRTLQARRRPA